MINVTSSYLETLLQGTVLLMLCARCNLSWDVLVLQQCYLYVAEFLKPFSLSYRWVALRSAIYAFKRTEQSEEIVAVTYHSSSCGFLWCGQNLILFRTCEGSGLRLGDFINDLREIEVWIC